MSSTSLAISDRRFMLLNALFSGLVLLLLAWLLVLRSGGSTGQDLRFMPAVNAGFNGTAAVLLLAGYRAIKRGQRRLHQRLMVSAFCASSLFFVGYLAYHYAHGDTKFAGQGPIRIAYFFVLISHVVLSVPVVPMALSAFYFAFQGRFQTHARLARWLYPIWLYVSVTGVLIYFMLRSAS